MMSKQLRVVAFASLAWLVWSGTATAQSWYYGGQAGVALTDEVEMEISGGSGIAGELDSGVVVGGVIGVSSGINPGALTGWRLEGEINYRQGDLIELGARTSSELGGDVSTLSLMVSVYTDFYVGNGFTPYIGAGLGVARVSANDITVFGADLLDDDAVGLAIQLGAGVAYELMPELTLTADARLFGVGSTIEMTDAFGNDLDIDFLGEGTLLVGIRVPF